MATYFTDFSEYSTGVHPPDWTERMSTADVAWTVESDAGATGGQVLRATPDAPDDQRFLSWDDAEDGGHDDVEIVTKLRITSGGIAYGVGVRANNDIDVYNVVIDEAADEIRTNKLVNTTFTNLATTAETLVAGDWWWVRLRLNGTTVRARFWKDGNPEPGTWDVDTTDSSISAAGWVGLWIFNGGQTVDYDVIGVGTNGDVAPDSESSPPTKPTISVDGATVNESSVGIDKTGGDAASSIDHTDGHIDTSDGFTPDAGNLVASEISGDGALDVNDIWAPTGRTPGTIEFATIVDYSEADESDGGAAADDVKYRLAPSVDTSLVLSDHSTDPQHGVAWSVTDNTGSDPGGAYPRIVQHKLSTDPWSNATEEIVTAGTTSGEFLGYSPGDTVDVRSVTFHTDLFQATDPGDGRIRSLASNAPSGSHTTQSQSTALFHYYYSQMRVA